MAEPGMDNKRTEVTVQDFNENTTLSLSASDGHKDAEVDAYYNHRRTMSHCAAWKGHNYVVQLLLDKGLGVDIQRLQQKDGVEFVTSGSVRRHLRLSKFKLV